MSLHKFSMIRPAVVADSGAFTRASTGTYTDSVGVMQTAAINEPRFAYNPATLAPTGLMIEAAATNLLSRSTGFLAGWVSNGGVTGWADNYGVAPDGSTTTTYAIIPGTRYLAATLPASTVCRYSKFFRKGAGLIGKLYADSPGVQGSSASVEFNLGTLVQTSITGSAISTAFEDFGAFVRVTMAFNSSAAGGSGTFHVYPLSGSPVEVWGAQVEAGSAATSYISTTISTVTRAADVNTLKLTSNVAEPATGDTPDPTAWAAATAYTLAQRASRIVAGVRHEIYQRVIAGTTATAPESDTVNWVKVGPTNKWRMYDAAYESQTSNNRAVQVVMVPDALVDNVTLDNLDADWAQCRVEGTTYNQTVNLKTRACSSWFQYFFEPFTLKKSAVFTGLPLLTTNRITVLAYKAGSVAKIGYCIPGLSRTLGYAEPGGTVGIIDYSTKITDQFGQTTVVQRAFSKRMSLSVMIENVDLDAVQLLLASYRALPVVWTGAGSLYSALMVYGYYRSFDIVIAYPTQSRCNIEIEGLT